MSRINEPSWRKVNLHLYMRMWPFCLSAIGIDSLQVR